MISEIDNKLVKKYGRVPDELIHNGNFIIARYFIDNVITEITIHKDAFRTAPRAAFDKDYVLKVLEK